MKRYTPDIEKGLSNKQVEERINEGNVNYNSSPITKSIKKIILDNTLTLFNILNICLAVAVITTKSYKNLVFLGVIICNTCISTFQEIKSKKVVDKLSLISESKVKVIRNGKEQEISKEEIVLDDLIKLVPGDQVVTDSIIVDGECEVNESCITGESANVHKQKSDMLLSGSFIVENRVITKVEHIGKNNYTSIITKDVKYIKKTNSELMRTLKLIIKCVSMAIIPVGLLLFYNQYIMIGNNINMAILNSVAAIIGMIPDGLILLTSTVLAVSTIRLAYNKVLVQELFCIETLARVDTLCIDKTGTITEGYMIVDDIIPIDNSIKYIENILKQITNGLDNDNATMDALIRRYPKTNDVELKDKVPFSSVYKYSAITTDKTYIIGAPDVLTEEKKLLKQINDLSKTNRVILLCESKNEIKDHKLPNGCKCIALIVLKDKVRMKARETLNFFKEQGIDVKIISGDSDITVTEIAKRVGIKNPKAVDMYDIKDEDIPSIVNNYNIFARVKPNQKKIIINSLKEKEHTVAMIGDGVNDVLALKESDCSIAMASGTDAARNVSQLVLLNSNFDSVPKILNEGRRSINNIERSASLFLTKTIYASILAIVFIILNATYPFEPIQLSLYNIVTIGIPSVILALEPNNEKIKKGFLIRVLKKAIPTSITVVFCMLLSMYIGDFMKLPQASISTVSIIVLVVIGFRMLYKISTPFNKLRYILFIFLMFLFLFICLFFRDLFNLVELDNLLLSLTMGISLLGLLVFDIVDKSFNFLANKVEKKE